MTLNELYLSIDVNECLYNPCQHNSPCSNTPGSYRCDCSPGWTGQNCDSGMCVHDHYVKWVKNEFSTHIAKIAFQKYISS